MRTEVILAAVVENVEKGGDTGGVGSGGGGENRERR